MRHPNPCNHVVPHDLCAIISIVMVCVYQECIQAVGVESNLNGVIEEQKIVGEIVSWTVG